MLTHNFQNDSEKWQHQEFYCPNSTSNDHPCGDPVSALDGKVYFTHRRLNFMRIEYGFWASKAVYRCPVCGYEHKETVQ